MVTATTGHFILLQRVSKHYQQPNGQQLSVVENINLELQRSEIVALLGSSG